VRPSLSPATARTNLTDRREVKLQEKADDLRIAHLSLRARPTAGAALALPEPHAADLGEARYPPGPVRQPALDRPKTAIFFAEHDHFLFLFRKPHAGAASFKRMKIVR
jgi:hypothetical protein